MQIPFIRLTTEITVCMLKVFEEHTQKPKGHINNESTKDHITEYK
jgi:hypothetical protein